MVGQTGEKISFFKQKIKPKGVDEALKFSQFTSYFTLQLVPELYLEIFLRERENEPSSPLRGSLTLSRRKISRKTSGTRVRWSYSFKDGKVTRKVVVFLT